MGEGSKEGPSQPPSGAPGKSTSPEPSEETPPPGGLQEDAPSERSSDEQEVSKTRPPSGPTRLKRLSLKLLSGTALVMGSKGAASLGVKLLSSFSAIEGDKFGRNPQHYRHHRKKLSLIPKLAKMAEPHDETGRIKRTTDPISNLEAFFLSVKGSFGTELLTLPYVIHKTGIILCCLIAVVVATLSFYGSSVMTNMMNEIADRKNLPYITYSETLYTCCMEGPLLVKKIASPSKFVATSLLVIMPVISCSLLKYYVAHTLADAYPFDLDRQYATAVYIMLISFPFLIISFIPTLRKIVVPCMASIFSAFAGYAILFFEMLKKDPVAKGHVLVGDYIYIPLFLALCVNATLTVALIIVIEQHMRHRDVYTKTFGTSNVAQFTIMFIQVVTAVLSYMKYGENIQKNVLDNITNKYFLKWAHTFFLGSVFLSYALMCYPIFQFVWIDLFQMVFKVNDRETVIWGIILHFVISFVITALIALVVPHLEVVNTVIGTVTICFIGFIFPALMEYCDVWKMTGGKHNTPAQIKDFLLIVFSVCIMVTTVAAVATNLRSWV